ncbi:PREDICTED: transcription factor GTE8-like isoform X2 [Ipomoea nil]|uniref:transcription factor GTE8-like isoform X2 n=1 Tax=Ipomoea nil TaxID=35883 RepID=UPI0009010299|nr:PREDICTED: transcription factor GTE8-like isoform X2 [Ipomoea nil]
MVSKKDRFSGGYSAGFATNYELEDSGSSGRIDTEMGVSQASTAPRRKWINLNSSSNDGFAVPLQVIPLAQLSPSERWNLVLQLKSELERTRILQKKIDLQRTNTVTASSCSDILSCSNTKKRPSVGNIKKSVGSGKKSSSNSLGQKPRGLNPGSSGRLEPAKLAPEQSSLNATLLKQCGNLLKNLMTHQHGWVFNEPVDPVKLNIPDYFTVIKHPMDLGTIKKKLASGQYSNPLDFLADVRLTFSNAMTYNPPGNHVHIMADTLRKFFEMRWKLIEKKIPVSIAESAEVNSGLHEESETTKPVSSKPVSSSKKRKLSPAHHMVIPEPPKLRMTNEEKNKLSRELEASLPDLPDNIIEFLKEQSSSGTEAGDDEIEIDIDVLSDETLFTLRKLLDDFFQQKQKDNAKAEACEIELQNESGFSNSSMQLDKDSDSSSSSDDDSDGHKASALSKQDQACLAASIIDRKGVNDLADGDGVISLFDQVEQSSQQKPNSSEFDGQQDGEISQNDRPASPEKLYRAALLKNRFADTILKAREKTLGQGEKGDPDQLRREREVLEMQRKKEKARLQAEAKAAEEARKRAEEEAAAEAKRKREFEREAARQALLKMEQTVEINENSRFLEDLEMLRVGPTEQHSPLNESSPQHSLDALGSFKFTGSNPLEQLGLYMKEDDDFEECEPPPSSVPKDAKDVEEGEID